MYQNPFTLITIRNILTATFPTKFGAKKIGQASSVCWLRITDSLFGLKPALFFQALPQRGEKDPSTAP